MAIPDWISDRLFYSNRREYTDLHGDIAYLDASPLKKTSKMSAQQRIIALVIVAVAIIIGALFVNSTILTYMRDAAMLQQTIDDNLKRTPSIESLPKMVSVVALDDEGIIGAFQEAGYKTFDASASTESPDLVLYRIPDDMTVDDASLYFAQGIGNLNAAQASKILNGSWYFTSDRENGTMVVRYADFSTNDPVVAVQSALKQQGFETDSITDSGEDESGNTYTAGTAVVDEHEYKWKISAIPLGDIYSVRNLPEDACYVGIRMTA